MSREISYLIIGAVVAGIINIALGVEFPASLGTAFVIVVVTVVALVLVDPRRGRPSRP